MKLNIVITSVRDERVGSAVADWTAAQARAHGKFEVAVTDLREVNLPVLDEPRHPRLGQYQHTHTKAWSAIVAASEAFVFVVPEYNYSMPPALLNALDYLSREWAYKPAAFVSYGGVSGGTRSAQMARQVLPVLKMVPLPEAVSLPFFTKLIDKEGKLQPGEPNEKAAVAMLDELWKWSEALAPLRAHHAKQ